MHARWDDADSSLRVYTSTQASTSVRAAIAAKLRAVAGEGRGHRARRRRRLRREDRAPVAGGAAGADGRDRARPRGQVEPRTAASTSSPRRTSGSSARRSRVGYDDDGRITALDVHIWHDNGAYTPYGIIVPIVTATQLVGPYVIPVYRVQVMSVFTNTVIVTPYRGAGRPQGCFAMERAMDRIAAGARAGPGRGARAQPDPGRPVPLRPPPDLPGRPAGHLRLGRLRRG